MDGLKGKGYYIWKLQECGDGNPVKIAEMAHEAGLGHVIIKIADGIGARNLDPSSGKDLAAQTVAELKKFGIIAWGWQYIYGYDPLREAQIALSRIMQTGVTGFVVNAEAEFKTRSDDRQRASNYMRALTAGVSAEDFPIGLSTYRRPDYHQKFPFAEFLTFSDFNLPQVYWLLSHDPVVQLTKCIYEFDKLPVKRPMLPTGAAWSENEWTSTPEDVIAFMKKTKELGMPAATFWSWQHAEKLPSLWKAISDFEWADESESEAGYMDLDLIRSLIDVIQKELQKPLR